MDESRDVKAPLTRLRRRVSIDSEGGQSPSTPSTPTKKRATRLAKPALELIDENVSDVPKRSTRKSVSRDIDPVEEKVLTPSRRSTRMRSNTSLVSEASVASPRAQRAAARRNSQLGSDTESSTPVRATRRTRKDSTSSVEKLAITNPIDKVAPVADPIVEEPEKETINQDNDSTPTLRKSPRLNKSKNFNKDFPKNQEETLNSSKLNRSATEVKTTNDTPMYSEEDNVSNKTEKDKLSTTITNIINDLASPKVSDLNKTTSDIVETNKSNRKRTKSWTPSKITEDNIINNEIINDGLKILNDKAEIKANTSLNKSLVFNSAVENKENILYMNSKDVLDNVETSKLLQMTPSGNMQSMVLIEDSDSGSVGKLSNDIKNVNEMGDQEQNDGDQCVPVVKQLTPKRSPRKSESFVCEPMDIDDTIPANVTLNDFSDKTDSSREEDANNSRRKSSISDKLTENYDASNKLDKQSINDENVIAMNESQKSRGNISITLHQETNTSKRKSSIGSLKENESLNKSEKTNKSRKSLPQDDDNNKVGDHNDSTTSVTKIVEKSKRKISINSQGDNEKMNDSTNKSKRGSISESLNDKTTNENKSTLVLSQHNMDLSPNETGNISKVNDTNNELSKSALIPEATKEDKKNLSLNCFSSTAKTSTPLQQKPLQKMAMQINSSIISPASKNNSKVEQTPKKRVSKVTEDSSDDEDSVDNSMIDDEAEEAIDDYESGDSRDEEERRYEEENEIIEKGETLESEKYESDESDDEYEKDSFVVSSDEEDKDLLSGSGDDLTLSDNELKMTEKSKKKYNERKVKEQKKASKEMYEARHNINNSKKSKKLRLDSSSSEEEDAQPKKKNRLRINSSHEISQNISDDNIQAKKKKVRQLSESMYEESNEKEITINNQSLGKEDPLLAAIKQEPKTPLKKMDISTVVINNNIEEVQMNASVSNTSLMKANETSDPLQATLAQNEEEDESESDISENMEIKQNYDSVLENLNKSNKMNQGKSINTSLNLNKKTKSSKDPIMEQLNLSQVKQSKKEKSRVQEKVIETPDEGETSDSIDIKLLFSENSNDSEVNASQFMPKNAEENVDGFISLKESKANTNVRQSLDTKNTSQNGFDLNVSKKKNKDRKSSQSIANDAACTDEPDSFGFFIDTVGAYGEVETSMQNSAKKNKKKNKISDISKQNDGDIEPMDVDAVEDETKAEIGTSLENPTLEISSTSDKKKKKNKSIIEENINDSVSQSGKRKSKKLSESVSEDKTASNLENPILEVSLKGDKKNKNKDVSITDQSMNESVSQSGKKKSKNLSESIVEDKTEASSENPILEVSLKSNKKNKNKNTSIIEEKLNESVSQSRKKKSKKLSESMIENKTTEDDADLPLEVSFRSEKANKKKKDTSINEHVNLSIHSEKKKKKLSESDLEHNSNDVNQTATDNVINTEPMTSGKKKRKKNKNTSQTSDEVNNELVSEIVEHNESNRKKKKLTISQNDDAPTEERIIYNADENQQLNEEGSTQKKSKKNKKSKHIDVPNEIEQDHIKEIRKRKKKRAHDEEESSKINPKKRKADDDYNDKISKIFRENSLDTIHVPRLPESIVNQLDDKPKAKKLKIKAISTTAFQVEETRTRRNKPSNYLEKSVYLNGDESPAKKKQKAPFKTPKVLPFTPTVLTSEQGFTSNFMINVLPPETQIAAQANNIPNFRNDFLSNQRVKKLGTFERFKRQRINKISKF